MTREEAEQKAGAYISKNHLVNAVYDDFESRTCENCMYFDAYKSCDAGECLELDIETSSKFGCNMFERKTDGNV